jgi:tyrosyl-tRNA synthetase
MKKLHDAIISIINKHPKAQIKLACLHPFTLPQQVSLIATLPDHEGKELASSIAFDNGARGIGEDAMVAMLSHLDGAYEEIKRNAETKPLDVKANVFGFISLPATLRELTVADSMFHAESMMENGMISLDGYLMTDTKKVKQLRKGDTHELVVFIEGCDVAPMKIRIV